MSHLHEAWRKIAASIVDQALGLVPVTDQNLISSVQFKDVSEYQGTPPGPMFYDDVSNTIYFFEGDTNVGSMVHEVGHAVDANLGWISHSKPFQVIADQYPDFTNLRGVHGRGRDSKYEEAWARGYAALFGGATPMTWPGNGSDLALVIREARTRV